MKLGQNWFLHCESVQQPLVNEFEHKRSTTQSSTIQGRQKIAFNTLAINGVFGSLSRI